MRSIIREIAKLRRRVKTVSTAKLVEVLLPIIQGVYEFMHQTYDAG